MHQSLGDTRQDGGLTQDRRLDKGVDQRRKSIRERRALGLKQGGDKEWMLVKFNRADFTRIVFR